MATFNLTKTNQTAITRLQPWTINEVVFKGVELKSGTSKEGNEWKAIQFKFAGDNGIFEPMFFCPKEGGDERMKGTTGSRNWELPSQMEQLAFTIAHVVGTLAPANYEKLKNISLNLPAEFDKLVDTISKALKSSVNKTTHIKLVGDNRGYASIPNFVNINKDGDCYLSNNWIGDNLAFSAYELKKKEEMSKSKPSSVESDDSIDVNDDSNDNSDLDFDLDI